MGIKPKEVQRDLRQPFWNRDDLHTFSPEERELILADTMAHEAKKLARFQAIAGVYQTADSVLTKSSISVTAGDFSQMDLGDSPAFNDGKTIYLNSNILKEVDDSSLISLNGVNYHEVAHILWSPRGNSEFGRNVASNGYFRAFNILEDMRIETLLVARFPSTTQSLIKSTLDYIMEKPEGSYPLIRGRKYLPLEIRQLSADLFITQKGVVFVNKMNNIIDEYRLLTYPSDYARGLHLIKEFHDLLDLESGKQTGGQCGDRQLLKSGRPEGNEKQNKIASRAKAMSNTNEEIKDKSGEDNQSGAGSQKPNNPVEYDPANQRKEQSDELVNAVREAIDKLMKSKQLKVEARQLRSAIRESDRASRKDVKNDYTQQEPDGAYRVASKAFGEELSRLRIDNDPHWQIEKPVGRLNINRVMNMNVNDITTVFDQWNEGRDDYNIEAVIMCDTSGSMGSIINETMQSMWAIKRALEQIEAKVTVLSFSDQIKTIYSSNDLATNRYRLAYDGGGTSPLEGLLDVESILESSRRKTKLLFIITDGEWSNNTDCDRTIARINEIDGVVSQVVYISSYASVDVNDPDVRVKILSQYRHNAHAIELVSKPRELVNVARSILRSL